MSLGPTSSTSRPALSEIISFCSSYNFFFLNISIIYNALLIQFLQSLHDHFDGTHTISHDIDTLRDQLRAFGRTRPGQLSLILFGKEPSSGASTHIPTSNYASKKYLRCIGSAQMSVSTLFWRGQRLQPSTSRPQLRQPRFCRARR